jgi:hypothetical protein
MASLGEYQTAAAEGCQYALAHLATGERISGVPETDNPYQQRRLGECTICHMGVELNVTVVDTHGGHNICSFFAKAMRDTLRPESN